MGQGLLVFMKSAVKLFPVTSQKPEQSTSEGCVSYLPLRGGKTYHCCLGNKDNRMTKQLEEKDKCYDINYIA